MTDQTTTKLPKKNYGSKTGWILLAIGWVIFLIPVPMFFIGFFVGGVLVMAALIMATLGMQKQEGGLALFLTALIGSPIIYLFGSSLAVIFF